MLLDVGDIGVANFNLHLEQANRLGDEMERPFRIVGRLVLIDDARNVALGVRRVCKCGPQLIDRRFAADLESEVLQLVIGSKLSKGEMRHVGRWLLPLRRMTDCRTDYDPTP
jgi:hypothetical protein